MTWIALIFPVILILVLALRIPKAGKKQQRPMAAALMITVLWLAGILLPVNRLLYGTGTPEQILQRMGKGRLVDVVYGDQSCLVLYQTPDDSYSSMVLREQKGGYGSANYFISMFPHMETSGERTLSYVVFRGLGLRDCYIQGNCILPGSDWVVRDSLGTEFAALSVPLEDTEFSLCIFFSRVKSLPKDYWIFLSE